MIYKVENYDINGKPIPDLSKVVLPENLQRFVISVKTGKGATNETHLTNQRSNAPAI